MGYQLPPDLEAKLESHLSTGEFADNDDVLRSAFEALERRRSGLAKLKAMIQEAKEDFAAGRVGPFNIDETMAAIGERPVDSAQA